MSHVQAHHLTPLGGRLPLKREISTRWQAGCFVVLVDGRTQNAVMLWPPTPVHVTIQTRM